MRCMGQPTDMGLNPVLMKALKELECLEKAAPTKGLYSQYKESMNNGKIILKSKNNNYVFKK